LPLVFVAIFGYTLYLSYGIFHNVTQTNANMFAVSDSQAKLHREELKQLSLLNEELAVTRQLYLESDAMLTQVSKELLTTKIILSQTEKMLSEARNETYTDKNGKSTTRAALEAKITALEAKNSELEKEMSLVDANLTQYSQIQNEAQGKDL